VRHWVEVSNLHPYIELVGQLTKGIKMGNLINKVKTTFVRVIKREEGVTAIEYGLIAALIALAIIVAVTLVGTNLSALFEKIAGKLV
jgi:pilus assembly protein Flp/PilA